MLCSFSVLPVVCGDILGNTSNTVFTTLKSKLTYNNQKMVFNKHFNFVLLTILSIGPGTPSFKTLTPHYSSTSKMLIKLEIEILTLVIKVILTCVCTLYCSLINCRIVSLMELEFSAALLLQPPTR